MQSSHAYDPMDNVYIAQFAMPSQLEPINLRTLAPFQRALLVTDGTVTKFIEAYTMEPIEITLLGQEVQLLSADHEWLEAPEGSEVLARQVLLRGRYSAILHAYAVSLILPERLPESIHHHFEVNGEGIGRILLNSQMETRRDVLWYGKERAHQLPPAIRDLADGDFISRTYRILANQQPLMLITEKFPCDIDWLPTSH